MSLTRNLALFAGITACTGVMAADLPLRSPPPAPFMPPPLFTWTGGYFGVNAGYVFDNVDSTRVTITGAGAPTFPTIRNRADGFIGGGQVGYNYEFGRGIVVGLEVDAAYTDLSHSEQGVIAYPRIGIPAGSTAFYRTNLDYLATIRGRVGYAFNQTLVYATGGFAFGSVGHNLRIAGPLGATIGTFGGSNTESGYAVGGGIEYALATDSFLNILHSSAVTVKAEYLHYDLGDTSTSGTFGNFSGTGRTGTSGDLARAGINYKF